VQCPDQIYYRILVSHPLTTVLTCKKTSRQGFEQAHCYPYYDHQSSDYGIPHGFMTISKTKQRFYLFEVVWSLEAHQTMLPFRIWWLCIDQNTKI